MIVFRSVRRWCTVLGLAALLLGLDAVYAAESLGPVVLTRVHGEPTAIWDSTSDLAAIVATKPSAEDVLRRLEADALTVLVHKAKSLKGDEKALTVQVIYQRSGAVSPTYQTATFLGVEHLFTLKAVVAEAETNAAAWSAQLKAGKIPAGVTINVTGKLPPELT
jgi:hypothetical protein